MFQKILYVFMGTIISGSLIFTSCSNIKNGGAPPIPVAPLIDLTKGGVKSSTDNLTATTATIKTHATQGMAQTPANVQPVLNPHWNSILVAVGSQDKIVQDLQLTQTQLTDESTKASDLQTAYTNEHNLRLKDEADATKELRAKYTWISIACFAILIISITLTVAGIGGGTVDKIAVGTAFASGLGLVTSIALVQTVALIPYIAGGIVIVGGGYVIYLIWKKNKTINTTTNQVQTVTQQAQSAAAQITQTNAQNMKLTTENMKLSQHNAMLQTASTELVHTVESVKPMLTLANRKKVFGDGPIIGTTHAIQSASTRELVKNVRSTLTNLAPKVPETVSVDCSSISISDDVDVEYQNDLPNVVTGRRVLKRRGVGKTRQRIEPELRTIVILH